MQVNETALVVVVPDYYTDTHVNTLVESVKPFASTARIDRVHPRITASVTLVAATMFIVKLLKPFWDGFSAEIGKQVAADAYPAMRNAIARFAQRSTSTLPSQNNARSSVFSVEVYAIDGKPLKFIFPDGLTTEQYEVFVDKLFQATLRYTETGGPTASGMHARIDPTIYLEYDAKDQVWNIVDIDDEFRKLAERPKPLSHLP